MEARRYNQQSPRYNESWASKALKIPLSNLGPDLSNEHLFVEVKFGLSRNNWTLVDYQFNYHSEYPNLQGLLLLGIYKLSKSVERMREGRDNLAKLITQREAWLTTWEHTLKLKICPAVKRQHQYKYLDHIEIPKEARTIKHTNGIIHISEDVPLELLGLK